MRSTAGSSRKSRAAAMRACSRLRSKTRSARRRRARRARRDRGDGRPRADREPGRRRRDRQSARVCEREAALRGQPSARSHLRARFSNATSSRRIRFSRCSSPAVTRSSSRSPVRPRCASSAGRATTPPAKRSTKRPGCSIFPSPADRRWKRSRAAAIAHAVAFPRYRPDPGALDLSFSGLKTSARYFLASDAARDVARADVAASFQAAIVDMLIDRVERALARAAVRALVLSGGVAANAVARRRRSAGVGEAHGLPAYVPERRFCTDNAAMIAAAADRIGEAALRRSAHAERRTRASLRVHRRVEPPPRERNFRQRPSGKSSPGYFLVNDVPGDAVRRGSSSSFVNLLRDFDQIVEIGYQHGGLSLLLHLIKPASAPRLLRHHRRLAAGAGRIRARLSRRRLLFASDRARNRRAAVRHRNARCSCATAAIRKASSPPSASTSSRTTSSCCTTTRTATRGLRRQPRPRSAGRRRRNPLSGDRTVRGALRIPAVPATTRFKAVFWGAFIKPVPPTPPG